jgi:hypothetical protein
LFLPQEHQKIFHQVNSSQVTNHTNNPFCILQRATAQSKTGIYRDNDVAEAPPGFKPAGLTVCSFSLSFCSFCLLIWS